MNKIRILQLGDLCISANDKQALARHKPFAAMWKKIERRRRFRYVVISGNVTADGRPESFALARKEIGAIVKRWLADDETIADRLMIVPGPADVGSSVAPDFANFAEFLAGLYDDLFGKAPPARFDGPNQIDYRQLKDMTLIGAPYWNIPDDEGADNAQQKLAELLEQRLGHLASEELEYATATPTVLVSAETPLLADPARLACDEKLRNIFNKRLRIWLHLFGHGSMTHVASEPFRYPHYSLGVDASQSVSSVRGTHAAPQTGGNGEAGGDPTMLWPLLMNLIEIECPYHRCHDKDARRPDPLRDKKTKVTAQVEHWRHNDPDNPARRTVEPSTPRHFYLRARDVARKDDQKLLGPLLKNLEKALFYGHPPASAMSVHVLPGCGLRLIYDKLTDRKKLVQKRVKVYGFKFPENQDDWEKQWRVLCKKLIAFRSEQASKQPPPLVAAVYDPSFAFLDGDTRNKRLEMMCDLMQDPEKMEYDFSRQALKLVHLTYLPDDVQTSSEFKTIELFTMDDDSVDELHNRYLRRIPLDTDQLRSYTGNALGFTRQVLESASDVFEADWPGGRRLAEATPRKLVEQVVEKEKMLNATAENFLQWLRLRDPIVGESLIMYIRHKLLEQSAGQNTVDFSEWRDANPPYRWENNALELLDYLCAKGFLTWANDEHTAAQVKVLAPFLCRAVYELFLSYGRPLEQVALRMKNALESSAPRLGQSVFVHSYRSDDWRSADFRRTDEGVEQRLRRSAGVIFLHGGDSIRDGVREEIEIWHEYGAHQQRPAILLIPNEAADPPLDDAPELSYLNSIYYETGKARGAIHRKFDDVAAELLNFFELNIAKGNLRWILRSREGPSQPQDVA